MKPLHWVLLAGLALAVPAAYVAAFAVGIAIGWNSTGKRTPPPTIIKYVDRPSAAPTASRR